MRRKTTMLLATIAMIVVAAAPAGAEPWRVVEDDLHYGILHASFDLGVSVFGERSVEKSCEGGLCSRPLRGFVRYDRSNARTESAGFDLEIEVAPEFRYRVPDRDSSLRWYAPYVDLEAVAWGRSRFLAAGLVPPRVRFVFHDDTERCRLRRGLFNPDTRTIDICNLNRETLIHELAHAWVDSNVTETARAEFTRHRGLEVWNDHSVPWAGRATEHAAEIVAWGVEEESRLISWIEPDGDHLLRLLTIPDSTPEELAAAFQMLTGIPVHPDRTKAQATLKPAFSPEARRLQYSLTK